MFLERLEINGFKSFAHKTLLEFKPGITAIVGPNGSGKSNVADAVRWVLGEQSIKLLRGKKSEDVIFSGSDKKARLGMAEVSLYFNNHVKLPADSAGRHVSSEKDTIEMSEICITRRLYRNGDSEYLINKQKTRLLDIQMILAKAGMAYSSYSIIGQGMIDAFLLASAQDRKEFFEEASGVKPLQIKRGQSLNKLEYTEENLETAQIQLQEITPRLNSLTRQVKKLERRAEVEIKLKDIQKKYYSAIWHEINNDWKSKHNELKKVAAEQEKMTAQVNELQNEMAKLTKDSAKSEEFEKLQEEYQSLLEQKMKFNQELSDLKIKAVQQAQKSVKHKDIPYSVGQEVCRGLERLEKLKDKMGSAFEDKDYEQIEKCFKEQNEILNELNKLLLPFKEKGEKPADLSSSGQQDDINAVQEEIEKVNQQVKEAQDKIKKESQKEKQERSHIWELQQKYQKQQAELNQVSFQLNNLRVELARLETKKDDLEQEIRPARGEEWVAFDRRRHSGMSPSSKMTEDWLVNSGRRHSLLRQGYGGQAGMSPSRVMSENEKRESITEIGKLKRQIELIGGIDPEVQKEYEEIKIRHDFLSTQINDLTKSMQSLEKLILELDENIKKQFEASFKIINQEFQKHFKILFAGGRSKLILVKDEQETRNKKQETNDDEENVELESMVDEKTEVQKITERLKSTHYAGVDIEATPPGKKLKSINMLSGGERALTSIALLCAIISANPSPFVVLDEVDAALDEANSIRFADILEELAKKSQFIVITHNRATMEKSDILYGVTMGDDGVSKLLSLKLEGAEKYTNR